jgi:hypothetical protein
MSAMQPICPAYGTGQIVAPAAASAVATLIQGSNQLVLTNLGAAVCHVRVGNAADAPVATTNDYPVPAGQQVTITRGQNQDGLAHICAAGTSLHIMNAEGFRN